MCCVVSLFVGTNTNFSFLDTEDDKNDTFVAIIDDFATKLEKHLFQSNRTYLTESFSSADVCVSLWMAFTMKKYGLVKLPQQAYRWMMTSLSAIQSYDKSTIAPLMEMMEEGEASPEQNAQATATVAAPPAAPAPATASEPAPTPSTTPISVATPTAPPSSGDFADNPLIQRLQSFGLEYSVYGHAPCMTAEELVANVPLAGPKETHTKNLFLRDKKHGMYLVTHATSTNFNTKQLGTLLNLQGKVNLRLADGTLLDQHLQVQPGCVGPLCIVNDTSKEVTLVLDKALMDNYEYIHSHPLRNDASVKLTPAALKDYLAKAGIEPIILDFSADGGAAAAADTSGKAPANRPPETKQAPKPKKQKDESQQQQQQSQQPSNKKQVEKGQTLLALQWKKSENFPMWYSDVIVLSEMIAYYDISGCYILRPWSYKIWDLIQQWFNAEVRKDKRIFFGFDREGGAK